MLRKILLPAVAAVTLFAGIGSASAHPTGYPHRAHVVPFPFPLHQVCRPDYDWKKVWTRHGWEWKRVYVGTRCHWVRR